MEEQKQAKQQMQTDSDKLDSIAKVVRMPKEWLPCV
jgi:hypothetical protein